MSLNREIEAKRKATQIMEEGLKEKARHGRNETHDYHDQDDDVRDGEVYDMIATWLRYVWSIRDRRWSEELSIRTEGMVEADPVNGAEQAVEMSKMHRDLDWQEALGMAGLDPDNAADVFTSSKGSESVRNLQWFSALERRFNLKSYGGPITPDAVAAAVDEVAHRMADTRAREWFRRGVSSALSDPENARELVETGADVHLFRDATGEPIPLPPWLTKGVRSDREMPPSPMLYFWECETCDAEEYAAESDVPDGWHRLPDDDLGDLALCPKCYGKLTSKIRTALDKERIF